MDQLIAQLSDAIWQRGRQDPSFDLFHHFTHPEEYTPATSEETRAWQAITSPDNYEALCAFVGERRRIPASAYALAMDELLLKAAEGRRQGSEQPA
jgi:hypothetical protein